MPHAWHVIDASLFSERHFNQVSMSQETQSAAPSKLLDPIEDVIQAISQGQMVVVVDDEHRENEGDLVMAGQWVNAEAVTFMAKMGEV